MTDVVELTSPFDLPWQTDIVGAVILAMFVIAAVYSAIKWRRGRRIYGVLMITAGIYGMMLEVIGMMILKIYHRGTFQIMLNPAALPLVPDSTPALPLYVVIYYPTMLFVGYKIIEALRVARPLNAAAVGGLAMIALEAPYVIQGHLDHLSWWTYNLDSPLVEFVGSWPMIDLCWLATCHAVFFAIIAAVRPSIDPHTVLGHTRWTNLFAALGFPSMAAVVVLAATSMISSPMSVVTLLGLPQWMIAAVVVTGFAVITVHTLMTAAPADHVEPVTTVLVGLYSATFAIMIVVSTASAQMPIGSTLVQIIGLVVAGFLATYPTLHRRRRMLADDTDLPAQVSSRT